MHHAAVPVGLPDEMVQHVRRGFEVRDYTVLHGLDSGDLLRCAAEHLSGLGAHCFHATGILAHRDDGRFVDYDTLVSLEHEGVGCAKIDCEIRTKQAAKGWCGQVRCTLVSSDQSIGTRLAGVTADVLPKVTSPNEIGEPGRFEIEWMLKGPV